MACWCIPGTEGGEYTALLAGHGRCRDGMYTPASSLLCMSGMLSAHRDSTHRTEGHLSAHRDSTHRTEEQHYAHRDRAHRTEE